MSKVCVVGLGYIGLPVASILASRGHDVCGCDIDLKVVETIARGQAHFFEPDLDMLLQASVGTGKLQVKAMPEQAEFFIIAVPTPLLPDNTPDLAHVRAAVRSIGPHLIHGAVVILESTSPVGTSEVIRTMLAEMRPDLTFPTYNGTEGDIAIAHCPERILPGNMLKELVANDRVIGGLSLSCAKRAAQLYLSFVRGQLLLTDCRTAEFVKLIENSFRDVNIALANEISTICSKLGINTWNAIELANRHPRVSILQPGAGVGGHCIAVDPWFIVDSAPQESRLIRAAREVNDSKPQWLVTQITKEVERLKYAKVACFGITYKADVEDLRGSPSLEIVRLLLARQIQVIICDPVVDKNSSALPANAVLAASVDLAIQHADILVFLVGHREFDRLKHQNFANKIVIDAIGLLAQRV